MKGCAVWPYGILLLKSQWSLSNMCWPLPMHKNEMSLVLWLFMAFRLAQHFAVLDAASIWQSSRANDTLAAQQWRRGGLKLIFYIGTRIIETFIVIASIVDRCPCIWFKGFNRYFCQIANVRKGNKRGFTNHPAMWSNCVPVGILRQYYIMFRSHESFIFLKIIPFSCWSILHHNIKSTRYMQRSVN